MEKNLKLSANFSIESVLHSCAEKDGFIFLDSNQAGGPGNESSFFLLEPVYKIYADRSRSYVESADSKIKEYSDSYSALCEFALPLIGGVENPEKLPLMAGYFSYEFAHLLEEVRNVPADLELPVYVFYIYRKVLRISTEGNAASLHRIGNFKDIKPLWLFDEVSGLEGGMEVLPDNLTEVDLSELEKHSNFNKQDYCSAVSAIRELIADGDVYQVNLSQRFKLDFSGSKASFYLKLRNISPSVYGSYININNLSGAGNFTICSSSPELFFTANEGNIKCSPIKGTTARANEESIDSENRKALLTSEKNLAELAMIVDLIRNDLGKIAETGSVRVTQHARLESYSQLHHLVSDVEASLKEPSNFISVIKALFPCGSITGAPKIAAMDYISEFEKCERGVYTGTIGYFTSLDSFVFSVAIRVALIKSQQMFFQTGGGVVIDSLPEDEYYETLIKARGLYLAYKSTNEFFEK